MHTLVLPGRITKDAELRYTSDEKSVSNFDLAVDDGFGDSKSTIWCKCSLWGKRAESLNQYLTKGTSVVVMGRLSHKEGNPRIWTGTDGTAHASFEVFVTDVTLMGGGKKSEQAETTDAADYF